jgi:EAL and modified HD-GYP domain-containing signal transduction protein
MKRLMEVFVGRQPILDRGCRTVAFELLFRSSRVNACDEQDAVEATSQVIVNAMLGVGLDRLLGGKPAFINFDRTLLLGDWVSLLSPENSIIELLENVPPDPEVLSACQRISEQGYVTALDDCVDDDRTAAFAPFVDVLKVDFRQTSPAEQERMAKRYGKGKLRLLAEKVETEQEFQWALKLGYHYFQGYFFAHPDVIQGARIPADEISSLRLVKQLQREEPDFRIVEQLIRQDISFTHSLLTYLNSAIFHFAGSIESVRHALLLLGTDELRRWGWMVSLSRMGRGRPAELTAQVLLRGRFCETIAGALGLSADADPFLVGMFSLIDAILQRPLEGILNDLNIGQNVRAALLEPPSESNLLGHVLQIVRAYETGNWGLAAAAVNAFGAPVSKINSCYLESVTWVDTMMAQNREASASAAASNPTRQFGFLRKTPVPAIAHAAH